MASEEPVGEAVREFRSGVSDKAGKAIRQAERRWQMQKFVNGILGELARRRNGTIRGWISYGAYHRSALYGSLRQTNREPAACSVRKYKQLRCKRRKAVEWLIRVANRRGDLFAHRRMLYGRAP